MFHLSDTVWYKTHRLQEQHILEKNVLQNAQLEESIEEPKRHFTLREKIVLKSGGVLIKIGTGLVGQVHKPSRDPQIV